jgi:fumarate reductase subunit D
MDLFTLLALLVGPVLVLFLLVGLAEELGLVARPEEDEEEREMIRSFLDGLFGEDEGA